MTSIQELAYTYSQHFERVDLEGVIITRCKEDAPQEVQEFTAYIGGQWDQYVCEFLLNALEAIAIAQDVENIKLIVCFDDEEVGKWLTSDLLTRKSYIDDFLSDEGDNACGLSFMQMLRAGHLAERKSVLWSTKNALTNIIYERSES